MNRPDISGIRTDVVDYITSLEQDSLQKQMELVRQDERINQMNLRIADLEQMLMNLQRMYFGHKSEKLQPALDGAEQLSFLTKDEVEPQPVEEEPIEVSTHKRKKKRTQEEIIASLPVFVHEYKLADEDVRCPRCGDEEMECIGRELVYTEYERVPAHVDRHDYYAYKYACHNCEEGTAVCDCCENAGSEMCSTCPDRPRMVVIQAQIPKEIITPLIKGSKASASIMAQAYDDKFVQGIPWYRQEKEWERLGFPISRQTMTNWALRIDKDYFRPVVSYMLRTAKQESSVLHCDETHVNVNNEKTERGNPKQCQMWVVRTGKYERKPIVVFNYRSTRTGKEPIDILSGYQKWFVSDGYSGYNELGKEATRCGCWAHLRRKLYDAVPGHNMNLPSTGRDGIRFIDRLFRIEETLESVAPEERHRVRNAESRKVMEEFFEWIESIDPNKSHLKQAQTFARNQKQYLMRFLDDPRIPISNNPAENAIRPFVVGRKNWLFCNSEAGATATANAYSLVETAKANGLDVKKYLQYILKKLPLAEGNLTHEFIEKIMPWNLEVRDKCQRGYI